MFTLTLMLIGHVLLILKLEHLVVLVPIFVLVSETHLQPCSVCAGTHADWPYLCLADTHGCASASFCTDAYVHSSVSARANTHPHAYTDAKSLAYTYAQTTSEPDPS